MIIIIMIIIVETAVVGIYIIMRIRNSNRNIDNTTPTTNNNKTYQYDYYDTFVMSKDIKMIRFERPIGIASSDLPDPQLRFKILDSSLGQGS